MVTGERLSRPVGIHDLRRRRVHGPLAHWDHRSVRGRALGRLGSRGRPLSAWLHPRRGTRRRNAGHPPTGPGRQRGPADAKSRRPRVHLRYRRQPRAVRRGPAREDGPSQPPAGPVRGVARPRGHRRAAAVPGDLPRYACLQRGPGRHAHPASPGRGGPQWARAGSVQDGRARRSPRRGQHSGPVARFPSPGAGAASPGRLAGRRGPAHRGLGGRPGHRGGRTAGSPLRCRRPVASRGRRRPAAVRGADRGGAGGRLGPGRGPGGRGQGGQAASRPGWPDRPGGRQGARPDPTIPPVPGRRGYSGSGRSAGSRAPGLHRIWPFRRFPGAGATAEPGSCRPSGSSARASPRPTPP